jgi:hypothetical protein
LRTNKQLIGQIPRRLPQAAFLLYEKGIISAKNFPARAFPLLFVYTNLYSKKYENICVQMNFAENICNYHWDEMPI